MEKIDQKLSVEEVFAARTRRLEAMRLQEIEGNPLDAEDISMFEMFERERWGSEQRINYIREQALKYAGPQTSE